MTTGAPHFGQIERLDAVRARLEDCNATGIETEGAFGGPLRSKE